MRGTASNIETNYVRLLFPREFPPKLEILRAEKVSSCWEGALICYQLYKSSSYKTKDF